MKKKKYIGPSCKLSRRVGTDLFLKSGITPIEKKCKIDKIPGLHSRSRIRVSDYGKQLLTKQRFRYTYGLREKQFKRYYKKALRKKDSTGEYFIKLLESRLDNAVYRLGFALTRREARQMVSHKLITVNGNKVNIPSYNISLNEEISFSKKAKKTKKVSSLSNSLDEKLVPSWFKITNKKELVGKMEFLPSLSDLPQDYMDILLVVEFYSK